MIQAFLDEVCCALKIDSNSITVTYSKNQTSYILVYFGDDIYFSSSDGELAYLGISSSVIKSFSFKLELLFGAIFFSKDFLY